MDTFLAFVILIPITTPSTNPLEQSSPPRCLDDGGQTVYSNIIFVHTSLAVYLVSFYCEVTTREY